MRDGLSRKGEKDGPTIKRMWNKASIRLSFLRVQDNQRMRLNKRDAHTSKTYIRVLSLTKSALAIAHARS